MERGSMVVFESKTYRGSVRVYRNSCNEIVIGVVLGDRINEVVLSPKIARRVAVELLNLSENLEEAGDGC